MLIQCKVRSLFLLLQLIGASVCFGQAPTLMPNIDNVVPPSPNASAIAKFGNIPVGPSTGIPNITVPIYNWKGKNFGKSFSINLAYHNGGIKVDEMASNVGLGWALNAGGVISRTVRGIFDELPYEGFLYRTLPINSAEGNDANTAPSDRLLNRMLYNKVDTQNDMFNYSFNGQSGRFVLGKNGDILFLEQTKIKVEKFIGYIEGDQRIYKFIITDEFGYRYVFEDYEMSYNNAGSYPKFTSSWYLSHVYNPTGNDSIEFQYENNDYTIYPGFSSSDAVPLFGDGFAEPYKSQGSSSTYIVGKRLKKIIFTDGNTVDFTYDNVHRQDLFGDYLLKKIKISKRNVSYGYLLNQDYSISGRATLLSVTPIGGASDTPDKPYTFEYVTNPSLPARLTIEQDHWGYANYNTTGFIPKEYVRAPGGAYNPFREFAGGNRDTDPSRVRAGSMYKISYPTGGYTIFDMEANTAKDNWLEQNETVTTTNPPYTDRNMNEGLNSDSYPAANVSFVFQGENNTDTGFDVTINPLSGNCSSACAIKLEIYNSSNTLLTSQQINFSDPSSDPYHITKHFNLGNLVKNQSYYIKAYTVNVSQYYDYMQINWRETNAGGTSTVTLSHVQPFVGGLRAKKVSDYTDGQNVQTKEYDYVNEDGVTSSGALGFRPVYTHLVRYDYVLPNIIYPYPSYVGNHDPIYAIRTSSTVNDIAYSNGSPVTYKRVVEKLTANGNNLGKTVRYFTNFKDSPPILMDVFPPVPTEYHPWALGLLEREEIYNAGGELLKKTENTYASHADEYALDPQRVENFRSISIAPVVFEWLGNPFTPHVTPWTYPQYILSSNFTPVAGRTDLTQTMVTEYKNGVSPKVSTSNYVYDPAEYYLKETTTNVSRGGTRKLVTEYPKDRAATGPNANVFAAMYSRNMIKNVVGEKQFANDTQLMYQWRDYGSWTPTLIAPSGAYSKYAGEGDELRVRYSDYDAHGGLVSVRQEKGVPICYLWGYGGDYLVAKISNAEYAAVKAILGGEAGIEAFRNDRNPTDESIEQKVNALKAGIPGCQVESFTYNTLAGITSHTEVSGKKSFYTYDLFGRLKSVKDQFGNIVTESSYHHKN